MNLLRLVLTVAWKELRVLSKDRGALALLFVMPLMLAGLMGGPQFASWREGIESGGPDISLNVVLVNQDTGSYGTQVADALRQVSIFDLQTQDDPSAADALVAARDADAAIIIPPDFTDKINSYTPTTMQLVVDPTQTQLVGMVGGVIDSIADEINLVGEISYGVRAVLDESGLLTGAPPEFQAAVQAQTVGAIMTQLNERRQEPRISVVSESAGGYTPAQYLDIIITAMLSGFAVLFAFTGMTFVTESVFAEKDSGAMRRLLAAPIPRGAIIAGKILAFMIVIALQLLVMIGVGNLVFGMPIGKSAPALLLAILMLALVVTAIGIFLASYIKSQKQASTIGLLLAMVLGAIGGCFLGLPEMLVFRSDSFMGTLARLTPQGNVLQALVSVMGDGAGVADILPQVGYLLVISIVLYVLAARRFRFE